MQNLFNEIKRTVLHGNSVAIVVLLFAACGISDATSGGGSSNLPDLRLIPWTPIDQLDSCDDQTDARVLVPQAGSILGLAAISTDDTLSLYFGIEVATPESAVKTSSIFRTQSSDGYQFDAPTLVLSGAHDWEQNHLAFPSIVRREAEWRMYFVGGNGAGIGTATSTDGATWSIASATPLLKQNSTTPRLTHITAVPVENDDWLWFERGEMDGIAFAKIDKQKKIEIVDANPKTNDIDPVLTTVASLDREARGVGSPHVTVTTYSTGRRQFHLWYAGRSLDETFDLFLAGSFDGVQWERFREDPLFVGGGAHKQSPIVVAFGEKRLMYFTRHNSTSDPRNVIGLAYNGFPSLEDASTCNP